MRLTSLVPAMLLGLLLPAGDARAQDAAATDAAPRSAQVLPNGSPKTLRKLISYEGAPFEMQVAPPIKLAEGLLVETLKYPSPVRSVDSERNDLVRARLFRTEKPGRSAVIALGGWRFDPLTPELGQRLARTGVQVLLIEIPFQGKRTPRGRRPGELTLSADLDQNEATFVQLAQDVARGLDWLQRERGVDPKRVGILGTSLGGFAAAILYGIDDRFKAAAVQLAGADVSSVLFNGNWLTRDIEAQLRTAGLDVDAVRKRMRAITPSTYARPARKDGLLLVAAGKDEIVPLTTVEDLAKLYGGARMIVMEDAPHRAAQGLRDAFPKVVEHLTLRLNGKKSVPE